MHSAHFLAHSRWSQEGTTQQGPLLLPCPLSSIGLGRQKVLKNESKGTVQDIQGEDSSPSPPPPHLPSSPGLASALQWCHVKTPNAQGSRHGEEHSQPAAGHNEGHEQAEIMDSWDLAMKRRRNEGVEGCRAGQAWSPEPADSTAKGPQTTPYKAGREGLGCWDGSHWPRTASEGKAWCQGTQQGRERRLLSVLQPAA